ncbi:MAG: DUF1176 domain-containing protein [Alphaproteobacteria bacterium]|nr:DUF1176 domain-containing protein [Alphaproteobacteria bacterium]
MLPVLNHVARTLFMFAALALPALAQNAGDERTLSADWMATCQPDTGYCSATTLVNPDPGNGTVADYVLRLGRQAEGIYWEISLTTNFDIPAFSAPLFANIDGTELKLTDGRDVAAFGAINEFFLLGDAAQFVLDKIVPAATITFSYTNEFDLPASARFSLDGLAGALVWIDERQRRLGAERVARDAPVGLGPPLTTRTAFSRLPRELTDLHRAFGRCDPPDDIPHANDIGIYALTGSATLFLLPCTAGAYNFSFRAYLDSGLGPTALLFADYTDRFGWQGAELLVNPEFNPETLALTSFYKGRGPADCGTRGTWVWDEFAFRMTLFLAKDICDFKGDAGAFPQVFP